MADLAKSSTALFTEEELYDMNDSHVKLLENKFAVDTPKVYKLYKDEFAKFKEEHKKEIADKLEEHAEEIEKLKVEHKIAEEDFDEQQYDDMKRFINNFLKQVGNKKIDDAYFKFDKEPSELEFRMLQKLFGVVNYNGWSRYDNCFTTRMFTRGGKIEKMKNEIYALEMELKDAMDVSDQD